MHVEQLPIRIRSDYVETSPTNARYYIDPHRYLMPTVCRHYSGLILQSKQNGGVCPQALTALFPVDNHLRLRAGAQSFGTGDIHEPNKEPRHPSLVDAVTTVATLVCIRWGTRHPSWCIAIPLDLGKATLLHVCDSTILTPFWRTWFSDIFETDSLVRRLMIPPHR